VPVAVVRAHDLRVELAGEAGTQRVLDGVSLEVDAGEIVDITGPSGSGKTTLLRAIARLLPGATGELYLDSVSAEQILPQRWRALVALLPQKPAIVDGDIRTNLLLPWTLKVRHAENRPDDAALDAALARVGLTDISLDRDAARLSVGQAARVALLRVLLTSPRVLLLDEPDASLDDASAAAVGRFAAASAEAGCAVIRVRHRSSDGLATRRFVLASGRLTPGEAGVS
jgi:putative ABC transport system ATP-binding protein